MGPLHWEHEVLATGPPGTPPPTLLDVGIFVPGLLWWLR